MPPPSTICLCYRFQCGACKKTCITILAVYSKQSVALCIPGVGFINVTCVDFAPGDAERIIKSGGVYVNHRQVQQPDFVLLPGEHILSNNITLIRVGE